MHVVKHLKKEWTVVLKKEFNSLYEFIRYEAMKSSSIFSHSDFC